jgi:hypothetical protein
MTSEVHNITELVGRNESVNCVYHIKSKSAKESAKGDNLIILK